MRVAQPINLTLEERTVLEQHSRARSMPARGVERARIVLRAAGGLENQQIAAELSITPEKVSRWRKRLLDDGFAALEKALRGRVAPAQSRISRSCGWSPRRLKRSQATPRIGVRERWPPPRDLVKRAFVASGTPMGLSRTWCAHSS